MVFLLPEYCFVIQSISKCREYQFLVHIFRHFNSKILFLILKTARWITNIMAFIWGGGGDNKGKAEIFYYILAKSSHFLTPIA